ncbi:Aste57867_8653 [Aphanomyces stellatus]|uniref:Aste57867_8653 protein n=1 Tax=Aphanomyces stellatus TaxID=120398 RepID=A0A485KKZ7_9STRA|nr:hypothetical protein As57867_008619 [Aphanomyces stellatus]VFT85539.1 Aste57867_8653 [Aphanomyces stellatus]
MWSSTNQILRGMMERMPATCSTTESAGMGKEHEIKTDTTADDMTPRVTQPKIKKKRKGQAQRMANYRREKKEEFETLQAMIEALEVTKTKLQRRHTGSDGGDTMMLTWKDVARALWEHRRTVEASHASLSTDVQSQQIVLQEMQRWVAKHGSVPTSSLDAAAPSWRNVTLPAHPAARKLGKEWILQHMYHNTDRVLREYGFPAINSDDNIVHDMVVDMTDAGYKGIYRSQSEIAATVEQFVGFIQGTTFTLQCLIAQYSPSLPLLVDETQGEMRQQALVTSRHECVNMLWGAFYSQDTSRCVLVLQQIQDDAAMASPQGARFRQRNRMSWYDIHRIREGHIKYRVLSLNLPSFSAETRAAALAEEARDFGFEEQLNGLSDHLKEVRLTQLIKAEALQRILSHLHFQICCNLSMTRARTGHGIGGVVVPDGLALEMDAATQKQLQKRLKRRGYIRKMMQQYREKERLEFAFLRSSAQQLEDELNAMLAAAIPKYDASAMLTWKEVATALEDEKNLVVMQKQALAEQVEDVQALVRDMSKWVAVHTGIPVHPRASMPSWRDVTLFANPASRELGKEWITKQLFFNSERMFRDHGFPDVSGTYFHDTTVSYSDDSFVIVQRSQHEMDPRVPTHLFLQYFTHKSCDAFMVNGLVKPDQCTIVEATDTTTLHRMTTWNNRRVNLLCGHFRDGPHRNVVVAQDIDDDETVDDDRPQRRRKMWMERTELPSGRFVIRMLMVVGPSKRREGMHVPLADDVDEVGVDIRGLSETDARRRHRHAAIDHAEQLFGVAMERSREYFMSFGPPPSKSAAT